MELDELKSFIRDAFEEVPYPGDDRIAGCSRSATPFGCDECDGIAEYFKGTTWQEHTPQSIIGCDAAFLLLKPEALHYYLPAFLIALLDDECGDCLPNVSGSIESMHWPGGGVVPEAEVRAHVSRLSQRQRAAVAEFFKYSCTDGGNYEPERANEIVNFLMDGSSSG